MNEKLRNHVNILFAAAPKTAKAEEVKEELLTNLNDKYNDLLANGYDSTAAFHLTLSGIGDIDELFKECGGTVLPNETVSPDPQCRQKGIPTSIVILIAVLLLLLGFSGSVSLFHGLTVDHHGIRAAGMQIGHDGIVFKPVRSFSVGSIGILLLCWAAGIGLLVYAIVRNAKSSKGEEFVLPSVNAAIPSDITSKKTTAGILAILLGCLGVHKFYLGFVGTGLIMLLVTVFSCGVLSTVVWTIGLVEGVLYLLKTDRDFYRDYEVKRRNWF